ncbi:HYR domain-containing protein [Pedococcus bigeumensis]|uniref:HYR domain-containing protein n=1 Tax=Pedococcus bigeumensis TaxID=433644 RepID=A0A502D4P9_9MICO|nr:HYR domain-containing protein [Pedococcus bigeumensis]
MQASMASAATPSPQQRPAAAAGKAAAEAKGGKGTGSKPAPRPRGRQADPATTLKGSWSRGTATFTIKAVPHRTYAVTVTATGDVTVGTTQRTVTMRGNGTASVVVPAKLGELRTGSVTVEVTSNDDEPLVSSSSVWLAPTRAGGVAQASTQQGSLVEAIKVDEPTQEGRRAAYLELSRMGADQTKLKLTRASTAAAAADSPLTISAHVSYRDWNGDSHPARHVQVEVDEKGFLGSHLGTTSTDDFGQFSLSADIGDNTDVRVTIKAESSAGRVGTSSFLSFDTYGQFVDIDGADPGDNAAFIVDVGRQDASGNAFAIHDALWSAHLFAVRSGHGDEAKVDVHYPAGDKNENAYTNSGGITLGAYEWSAWDVVNHEYGHWYDMHHDLTPLIGGTHCVSANLASDNCDLKDDVGNLIAPRGKSDGGKLAWSEGYADYYALAAGQLEAHPTIAGVGDGYYDDVRNGEDGTDHDGFNARADGGESVTFHGEDNEMSISGVLWGMAAEGTYPLGAAYLDSLIAASPGNRLSDLLNYAWESDTSSRLTGSQESALGCELSSARIAPYGLTPTTGELSKPPTFSWQEGNTPNAGTSYANDRFVVQAVDSATSSNPYFTSSTLTSTSWTPTGREWSSISDGRSTVYLRVVGTSTSDPQTGPFRGCAQATSVSAGAVINDQACTATSLSPNDDGSTGAVDLPFAINYFGTTYTYLFVNNNGNVTFNQPMSTFTPFTLTANVPPIIAPFFADIDTRGTGSAPVRYGYGTTTYNGRAAFCVDWVNVGYYSGHDDKLVSAQLLLVDRSDLAPGDFDMVFNYGHIQWETGDASGGFGGFGGTPAGVGYSAGNGQADGFFQLEGSMQSGQLVDGGPHALVSHSNLGLNSDGHYLFKVRGGNAGNSSTGVQGTVTSGGVPVEGAPLQVCPHGGGQCVYQTRTGANGTFSAVGLAPGVYDVSAYPPSGTNARPRTAASVVVEEGELTRVDIDLASIAGVPPGTTLGPLVGSGDIPMVNWQDTLTLRTTGCVGGTATYEVISTEGSTIGSSFASGPLSAGGEGHYSASIPPLYPHHGAAEVLVVIVCPDGSTQTVVFDIYIDPSGLVVDQRGTPVSGATVTLSRSDAPEGPFATVPTGSDIMSPANRANPMTTLASGHFGWDVVAGFYRVVASKAGCTDASTDVLAIPPPVTDLRLVMTCGPTDTEPPVLTVVDRTFEGNATGGWRGTLTGVTVDDPDSAADEVHLTNDAPALLPLGTTTVTWTATDPAGHSATATQQVRVVDTTRPTIQCPVDVAAFYTGAPSLGTPATSDVVDPNPSVTHTAPAQWPLGTTEVTWTATDGSHNAASCVQRVTLRLPLTATTAAGDEHTLAVLADGTVKAWGAGGNGQLGRGSTVGSTTPVTVPGLTGVRAVAAGGLFSVALDSTGAVYTWGDNSTGQLGDGTTTSRTTPRAVTGLPPIAAIAAGRNHVLAVALDGAVYAWGANTFGQTGKPPSSTVLRPARVAGLPAVKGVAAGQFHSVAATTDGRVYTFGAGYSGQLGDGTATSRATPAAVAGLSGVAAVGAGYQHTLAVTADGKVYAWGANAKGQLGTGSTTPSRSPVQVTAGGAVRWASGGSAHTVLLMADGSVRAFGDNGEGQLGDGSRVDRLSPVRVTGLTGATSLAVGADFSVSGRSTGSASAWGGNRAGQLGDGTTTRRTSPVTVAGVTTVAQPSGS